MGITFSWYIENRIALSELSGRITTDDLSTGNQIVSAWMDASPAQMVHIIFNATDMKGIDFSGGKTIAMLKYLNHKRMGGILIYGTPSKYRGIINVLGTSVSKLTRADFQSFNTIEECVAYIRSIDPDIPDQES